MLTKLLSRCAATIDSFRTEGDCQDTADGVLIHRDHGANVLAVAHLDTVLATSPKLVHHKHGLKVRCPQLDDRLGAWMLLDYLPSLGIKFDVLLTDSEEIGRSTAGYFNSGKTYNWMFQFDRRGQDVVMYEYETPLAVERLQGVGFNVGWGTFSDICSLDKLGCQGFNFGVGYHNEHTTRCHAKIADVLFQAEMFASFHQLWANTPMPWTPTPRKVIAPWIAPNKRQTSFTSKPGKRGNRRIWSADEYLGSRMVSDRDCEFAYNWALTGKEFGDADRLAIDYGYGGFYDFMRAEAITGEQEAFALLRKYNGE